MVSGITCSKGTKHSKNSCGSSGQSDLKASSRKRSNRDPFQSDTRRRNNPHFHGRVQQRLEGSKYGDNSDDGWQWRMAPESGDPRESRASPNIDDDDDDDQSPQPSRRRTVMVPIIPWESQVSTSFEDDNNDDNNGVDNNGDLTTSTCESRSRRESHQLSNATPPSNQEHAWQLQKCDQSPVDIGRRLKRKVGDIGVSKVWWDVAHDIFLCRILSEDPYPTDVDKLSAESFKRECSYLNEALQGDISTAAIHTSAARGIFAEHAREIAPDQYIDKFRNISNDDQPKQVARLISPCT
ncbi:hypothetical protein BDD12DRAFT_807159 [Trichophaea hybrida]|nr:hypothetical protein BDD12DRAFT_807159 [Trichophaea hybrida]